MCGIVGCVGVEHATEFVTNGLVDLKYRGYDSAGVGWVDEAQAEIQHHKAMGSPENLRDGFPQNLATLAIGHNRWATHGGKTKPNAHPHYSTKLDVMSVANGVIENYKDLRAELVEGGARFTSQTDTEVLPHLISYYRNEGASREEAVILARSRVTGSFAMLAVFRDDEALYATSVGASLMIGTDPVNKRSYAASDTSVFAEIDPKVLTLENNDLAILRASGVTLINTESRKPSLRKFEKLNAGYEKASLGNFKHWMLKEIHDTPDTVRSAISGRVLPDERIIKLGGLQEVREKLRTTERFILLGSGTSFHAALVGERLLGELSGIPAQARLASDFKDRKDPIERNTAAIALSQSGETADTLRALEKAGEHGMLRLGVINAPGSAVDRITDAGVHCRAGKEVSVASTKAFVSQVAVMAEVALAIGNHTSELQQTIAEELTTLPQKIEQILLDTDAIQAAAKAYAHYQNFLYIGRGYEYASALEGALKLKEVTYINALGCEAGEMKHGTLALIDEDFPTFAIATDSELYEKTVSNIEEIKSRDGARVIALANEGNKGITDHVDDVIYVPKTTEQLQPILNAVAMQLFAYYVGIARGVNIDQPRNLAKSVTVE